MLACKSTSADESGGVEGQLEVTRQFLHSSDYRKAIATLQDARRMHPKDYRVEGFLGLAYMGLNDYTAASHSFQRAIELNEDDLDSRLNLAYALTVKGDYKGARAQLDLIIESRRFGLMEKVYNNYGLTYLQERRCELAVKKFESALQIDPTFVSAHFNVGRCQIMSKNYNKAIESLKKAIDFCPDCAEPAIELARAQYLAGKRKAAVAQLESVLAGKPDRSTEERTRKMLQEFRR